MQIKNKTRRLFFLVFVGLIIVGLSACINNNTSDESISTNTVEAQFTAVPTEIVNQDFYDQFLKGEYIRISEIQGPGHNSPYTRKTLNDIAGIVTAKRADGFYMQSAVPDDNDATSEGVFVFLNKPPMLDIGDLVFVNGKITEFYPGGSETGNLSITEIEEAGYTIVTKNNSLPTPITIGIGGRIPPTEIIDDDNKDIFELTDGLDFYESLESMLVQINDAVVVGPTSAYKEIAVLADSGLNATGINERRGITISEFDFNPERIVLDDSLASLPELAVGEKISEPIIGIVDYTFGNFKIQATKRVKGVGGGISPEIAQVSNENGLTIASYNVENLDANDSDKRFEVLAVHIVSNLKSPDILALQEIQDNDGAMGSSDPAADITYSKIIDAILNAGGPQYTAINIDPVPNKDGGEPGGNIRVGFLYREDSGLSLADLPSGDPETAVKIVKINEQTDINLNPARIDPQNYAFVDSRKPLMVEFLYNGKKLYIINNHWNSKGGDTPLFGTIQPPRLESEIQRKKQAQVVADFISDFLRSDPEGLIVVLGDLNDFYFSEPLKILENSGMINLFDLLEINERYTYIYDGNSQALDNMLVSPGMFEYVEDFDVIHINSEFPNRENFSDHDPIIVSLGL